MKKRQKQLEADKIALVESAKSEVMSIAMLAAEKIIAENAEAVEEYKKGKLSSLQFLIGQAMKEMKGSGNPVVLKKVFEELLG